MQNIMYHVEGNKLLVIEVDLTVNLGPSSTGNSNFVAKTGGWKKLSDVEEGLSMNMNLTRVLPRSQRANPGTGNYSAQAKAKTLKPKMDIDDYLERFETRHFGY